MYLINDISFISTVNKNHQYDLAKLLKVYDWTVWLTLTLTILILIALASVKYTLWKSFISFTEPLFGKGNPLAIKCFTYVTYLLALIPIIEIIKNELLSSLVAMDEIKSDTLDDLLNPNVFTGIFDDIPYYFEESEKVDEEILKRKLIALFNKTKEITLEFLLKLHNPEESNKIKRDFAIIDDDISLRNIQVSISIYYHNLISHLKSCEYR